MLNIRAVCSVPMLLVLWRIEVRPVVQMSLGWQLVELAVLPCKHGVLQCKHSLLDGRHTVRVFLVNEGFLFKRLLELCRFWVESVDVLPLALESRPFIETEQQSTSQ